MDINELNKKQLILLTLLVTFVVSIGTGIVTVSLMKQMPPTVPQTINNVIQRTIEKVTTVEETKNQESKSGDSLNINSGNQLVSIFKKIPSVATGENSLEEKDKEIGQGVIISDEGLILVNTNIIDNKDKYEVQLGEDMFSVYTLKNFDNGFAILKIGEDKSSQKPVEETAETETQNNN